MFALQIQSGPDRGKRIEVKRFPARFGKGQGSEYRLTGPGVWDEHFELVLGEAGRAVLNVVGDGRVMVDEAPVRSVSLRDGLVLEVGGVRLQVLVVGRPQGELRVREGLFWILLAIVVGVEAWLIWWVGRG